ncbi:hypothetical protein ATCC90586_010593 [Pythium insidiosum]|nr:hypothetical protein ATCC90586_010593 [Pythium insidiosum]
MPSQPASAIGKVGKVGKIGTAASKTALVAPKISVADRNKRAAATTSTSTVAKTASVGKSASGAKSASVGNSASGAKSASLAKCASVAKTVSAAKSASVTTTASTAETASTAKSRKSSGRPASSRRTQSAADSHVATSSKLTDASPQRRCLSPTTSTSSSTVDEILRDPEHIALQKNIEDALQCATSLVERLFVDRETSTRTRYVKPREQDDDDLEDKSPIPASHRVDHHHSGMNDDDAMLPCATPVVSSSWSSRATPDASCAKPKRDGERLIFG